ncbi:hypothetical protein GLOIN_2v1875191 [Rhizophagus irregularis DAOM 181602=DAOM 197198]|uniref:Uncharacterized protein n=1 Tax=Rhizophagus irregularis (strain DAOM 181602 / DAOM 197198 / MUCL 43194) TaxID=747089 RepID=A0A2P4Q4A8_RHIID|nr:hypothetical protein GLOIN_2v1875191 [Rhizophagus irregularis DAOM 181602=DAOM 197198]POG72491.1 hypothetical protein GLOIN_2v1875191 [Rhizophagus irregularis DAOM 181602=DAOM 197198]|eukprot:XP_025179357.1 hypothetical protein GLOIN_2v1875191 [Rhizophagus irregularis DAOM 181602=DAOM 197198]
MAHIKFRYGLDNSRSFSVPLAKAILGLPVKKMDVVKTEEKNDVYNEEKIFTYEDLSSMGVVYLDMRKTLFKGAHFSHTFPNVKVALPDVEDIKLYKLNHRYPVTQSYEKTPVKYENMKEIRNGYLDLDLLKNDNIKKYIGCVFLNAAGKLGISLGFLMTKV